MFIASKCDTNRQIQIHTNQTGKLKSVEAIDALINRVSVPRVGSELPNSTEMEKIFQAALRAPDHAQLRPWRFLTVSGDDLLNLGELFLKAQLQDDATLSNVAQVKAKSKPLRAPLIVVAIADLKDHPKVPEIEQMRKSVV